MFIYGENGHFQSEALYIPLITLFNQGGSKYPPKTPAKTPAKTCTQHQIFMDDHGHKDNDDQPVTKNPASPLPAVNADFTTGNTSPKSNSRDGTLTHTPLRAGDFKSPADISYPFVSKEVIESGVSNFAKSPAEILQNHPELQQIIQAWPDLNPGIHEAILKLAEIT